MCVNLTNIYETSYHPQPKRLFEDQVLILLSDMQMNS